jgi:YggT family protein
MFVIGNLLSAVATILSVAIQGLMIVIFVNALLSWVRPDPSNPIVRLLESISDFACAPIRKIMPTTISGFDFAPIVAILALIFVDRFVVQSIRDLAIRL